MSFLSALFPPAVAAREVRAEIWRLGGRHRGRPLDGALTELKNPNLTASQGVLLRACVDKLRSDKS